MKRFAALLGAGTVLALAVCTGPAAAAGNSAARGGAMDMLHDPTMATVPMVNDQNGNGNVGMFCAVFITNGSVSPGGCNGGH
jgi:hypothetical protein